MQAQSLKGLGLRFEFDLLARLIERRDEVRVVPERAAQLRDRVPDLARGRFPRVTAGAHVRELEAKGLVRGYVGRGVDLAIATCVPEHAGVAEGVSVLAAIALVVQDLWGLALETAARCVAQLGAMPPRAK